MVRSRADPRRQSRPGPSRPKPSSEFLTNVCIVLPFVSAGKERRAAGVERNVRRQMAQRAGSAGKQARKMQ